jgi:hypothetical protein
VFVRGADGRHYKHFLLVDANSGHERLAVVGEDSARQDRRYTYKALEDVGGYCFENGKAVSPVPAARPVSACYFGVHGHAPAQHCRSAADWLRLCCLSRQCAESVGYFKS